TADVYQYLFAKYDGPNTGAEVWYVGDLSGVITIPALGLSGEDFGLSGWTLFRGPSLLPSFFCTLAQGAYGNAKGKTYLGDMLVDRVQLLTALLDTDLRLGVLDERSLTITGGSSFAAESASCIIARLPAGTSAKILYAQMAGP